MRHLLFIDRFNQPISRIMFGETTPQDVTTDARPYAPAEVRPDYVRQLKLLAVHAGHSGLEIVIIPGLRTRPDYTQTVPVLVTGVRFVQNDRDPGAPAGVQAHFIYIDGDHAENGTAMLYTPEHGELRPSFVHAGDLNGVHQSGAVQINALRTEGHT